MKIAAIDCGTNSIRLLIAEHDGERLHDIRREMRIVRLGQGVDQTRRFAEDALARTFEAAREYKNYLDDEGIEMLRFGATSATRDAHNREEFLAGIENIFGVRPEVISGEEEAFLSFIGAASVLGSDAHSALVVDLGGGSTELVAGRHAAGDGGTRVNHAVSIDVGSVRLTERHLASDPPTREEITAARADVRAALTEVSGGFDFSQIDALIGTAGTITTVTAHALGLEQYDSNRINAARLTPVQIHAACEDLIARTRAERAELGFLHPGRIDVIGAGALIWSEIVAWATEQFRATGRSLEYVTTSEHDILDGLALSQL